MSKLRLGFYPYTYARISVMKSLLITPDRWASLVKMGFNEILRYLQDSGYKEEIDALGVEKQNLAALELALNKNLMRTFKKLHKISDEKVQEVLSVYLKRYDMENFKSIIRGKLTGVNDEEIAGMLIPSINHELEYFTDLMKKEKVEDIIKELPLDVEIKEMELFAVENALDKAYYFELFELANRIRGQGKPIREFFEAELAILNIKTILRLKKGDYSKEEITSHLINPSQDVLELLEKEDVNAMVKLLTKKKMISIDVDDSRGNIMPDVEIDLDIALLKKESLLRHTNPLTVNVILGFMFTKEIEVKNLKILLKGKMLGIGEEYLSKLLVMV